MGFYEEEVLNLFGGSGGSETLNVYTGRLTTKTGSTGTVSYTGLGFQPKAIIFYSANTTTEGSTATHGANMTGFTTGVGENASVHVGCVDGQANTDNFRIGGDTSCITIYGVTTQVVAVSAHLHSFDADGFTLDYDNVVSAIPVYYTAYGGDITAEVGKFQQDATSGVHTQNVSTGIANADFVMLTSTQSTAENLNVHSILMTGVADGLGNRGVSYSRSPDNQTLSDTWRYQEDDKVLAFTDGSKSLIVTADFGGFTAGGFDLDYTAADGITRYIYYLTIKGGSWEVGAGITPTGTTTEAFTTTFEPKSVQYMTVGRVPSGIVGVNLQHYIGGTDGTTQNSIGLHSRDNVGTSVCNRFNEDNELVTYMWATSILQKCTFDSFNATDFSLTWNTNDGVAREFIWWVCGDG